MIATAGAERRRRQGDQLHFPHWEVVIGRNEEEVTDT